MSTIRVNTIQNTSGVEVYTAKAWVNFNGTGVVAIRASGNVSSITDNGTGDYTVNFTTAMPDVNYAVKGSVGGAVGSGSGFFLYDQATARTTALFRIASLTNAGSLVDSAQVNISIHR